MAHLGPMEIFAERVRQRAEELQLSLAEVARRTGISDRRLSHYLSQRSEPNLATLLRLASVLATTPNDLLGVGDHPVGRARERDQLRRRITSAIENLEVGDLKLLVALLDAAVRHKAGMVD